jgi:hypothetical protein
MRYPSCGTPAKFTTHTSGAPSSAYRMKENVLCAESSAVIQRNPSGLLSCVHSGGLAR